MRKTFNFDDLYLRCFGISENRCKKILSNIYDFANNYSCSGPDLYCMTANSVLGIEHFTYDASQKNKKGSKEQRRVNKIHKEFYKESRRLHQDGIQSLQRTYNLNTDNNEATLKSNFLLSFNKHICKIDSYNNNISKKLHAKESELWLIAEDISLMGPMFHSNYIVDNYPEIPLLPGFYADIQEAITKSPIQGIIFASNFPISNCLIFIKNNLNNFKDLQNYYHFSDNVATHFFNDSLYVM